MIRVLNREEQRARRKPFEDFQEQLRLGFTRDDLPKDRDGNIQAGFRTNMMRVPRDNYRRATEFFKSPQGRDILARKKVEFQNLREKLRADRIRDPLRTKTFRVREGGADGVSTTFRQPVSDYNTGQEIFSNFLAAQRGRGMTKSGKIGNQTAAGLMRDYGQRAVITGDIPGPKTVTTNGITTTTIARPNISLNPESNIDFSRRLV